MLAIDGGEPVRETYLPFGVPCLGEEEINEVVATLRSGWIGSGPRSIQFENEFATYVGAKHAISLNSCTAGLFLSLKVLGIGRGDEVVTTPLTFAATANVIEHVGAKPVFVDIDPFLLNIDPNRLEDQLRLRRKAGVSDKKSSVKAILPVHFGGLPCELDTLHDIAERFDLTVIEDAAHAVGARYKGKMIGSISRLTCFSFYANKNLTTAEGGMVTTGDPLLQERLQIYRLHGLSKDAWKRFGARSIKSDVTLPGYKFNMPDVAAALGLHQLRKQEQFLRIREQYARLYDEAFAELPVCTQPRKTVSDGNHAQERTSRHALHLYVLILQDGAFRVSRDHIVVALQAENIGAAVHYRALHMEPWYRETYGYKSEDFPEAYSIGEHIFSLPLTPAMCEKDVEDVIYGVQKVLGAYKR